MDNRGARNGFTLVELLIVTALIGVLATISVLQYVSYRTRGCNSAAISDLGSFKAAMETYYAEHNMFP